VRDPEFYGRPVCAQRRPLCPLRHSPGLQLGSASLPGDSPAHEIAFDRARTDARLFKQECNRARRRVEGALLQRLPGSKQRVASYFKPVNDASVVEETDAPPPPPASPGAVTPG
jgi:hypothetical protein